MVERSGGGGGGAGGCGTLIGPARILVNFGIEIAVTASSAIQLEMCTGMIRCMAGKSIRQCPDLVKKYKGP